MSRALSKKFKDQQRQSAYQVEHARRLQKRAATQYLISMSFNDRLIHETVSRSNEAEVQSHLCEKFGFCDQSAVPTVFKGIILMNDYGHGIFQQE